MPEPQRLAAPSMLPRAPDRRAAIGLLAGALAISEDAPLRVIRTPVEHVVLDYGWLTHVVENEKAAREPYANFILPTLRTTFEVWTAEYEDGFRRRYIGLFDQAGTMAIVRVNRDGSLFWNFMKAKAAYPNAQRSGVLLYPGPAK